MCARGGARAAARAAVNNLFLKLKNQENHTLGNRGLADGEMGPMRCVYAMEAHDSPSTGAPGHRLSVFLFLNFYRDLKQVGKPIQRSAPSKPGF
jgi:hypothetical protein